MNYKLSLTESEKFLLRAVKRKNGSIWVVGGAIRDLLLGHKPKDIDFVTDLPPALSGGACQELGLSLVPDRTALDHGIIRVATQEGIIDLATLRQDSSCDGRHCEVTFTASIEEDLARRDLTFNSIAATINEDGELGELIDPFKGQRDLEKSEIVFVGDPNERIREDYLRMVRACRFCALNDGFWIAPDIQELIGRHASKITTISVERIRDEIIKAVDYSKPSGFFRALLHCQLLEHIIAPIYKCVGVGGGEYHAEEVFDHLMYAVDACAEFTDNTMLRLAAALHDVGKPMVKTITDGRAHFYEHETRGASIVYKWMKDMKFSNKDIEYVSKLVRHHQWRFMDDSKDKTIRRWLRDVGDCWKDLITLRSADRKGNMAKQEKPIVTNKMRELISRAETIIATGDPIFDGDLAINGDDLKKMGIKPGPVYKDIFQKIWALVINEPQKNTKDYLKEFVMKRCINATGPEGHSEYLAEGAYKSKH